MTDSLVFGVAFVLICLTVGLLLGTSSGTRWVQTML